jgi:hypothetical protein
LDNEDTKKETSKNGTKDDGKDGETTPKRKLVEDTVVKQLTKNQTISRVEILSKPLFEYMDKNALIDTVKIFIGTNLCNHTPKETKAGVRYKMQCLPGATGTYVKLVSTKQKLAFADIKVFSDDITQQEPWYRVHYSRYKNLFKIDYSNMKT